MINNVDNKYKKTIDEFIENQDIDCIGILKYLDKYSGKKYCAEYNRTEENRKEIEENETAAKRAKSELEKIVTICEKCFELKKYGPNSWLDRSEVKLRSYLWVQLKNPNKLDDPKSISLFVEPSDKQKTSRFRVSLELDNKKAKNISGEIERYHKHLEIPLNYEKGLEYVIGSNENDDILNTVENQNEIIEKVRMGKYRKVQISRIIEWSENLTNEDCIRIIIEAVRELLPYYEYVIGNLSYEEVLNKMNKELSSANFDKNMILYGPPGTGKTYSTAKYAVAICDEKNIEDLNDYEKVMKRYKELKDEGRIVFTTFHQSYGYEEFIEGIKPVINNEEEETNIKNSEEEKKLKYVIEPGIFKEFCQNIEKEYISDELDIKLNSSPKVWKVSLKGTGDNPIRRECMENGHIRINWDCYGEDITAEKEFKNDGKNVLNAFISKMRIGDIVLSCYSENTIDAVGVITGDYKWSEEYTEYKRLRKVKWLAKDLNYNILELNDNFPMTLSSVYEMHRITYKDALKIAGYNNEQNKNKNGNKENYVFIIDEINRGNISKIFGELITLIEPSKRIGKEQEIQVRLPYSKEEFGVPDNVYIIGTMNTADRSIAFIDTALRRRFQFIEMMPDTKLLKYIKIKNLDIAKMLDTINQRIEILYDKEHMIGHAIFMELQKEPTIEKLASIFEKSLIPLLEEYFYDDYSKIQLILGKKIIKKERIEKIFKVEVEGIDLPEEKYEISKEALDSIESYIEIYE